MTADNAIDERVVRDATQKMIDLALSFDDDVRRRIFRTALTFYGFDLSLQPRTAAVSAPQSQSPHATRATSFADHSELPPKDFLFRKQPQTDVERAACLAYYLTHYRETRHFKTVDISLLNTEAAQVKFSNTAYAVVNAVNAGLLVPAGKGFKQLSAIGERFVEALPDRNSAKEVLASMRLRRGRRGIKNNKALLTHSSGKHAAE